MNIFFQRSGNQQDHGNKIMNHLGQAFRFWCRRKRIERPPTTWDLHLIGRGDSDSKNTYPVLASGVKAAHCKPILFFLSDIATEIASHCKCVLVGQNIFWSNNPFDKTWVSKVKFIQGSLVEKLPIYGVYIYRERERSDVTSGVKFLVKTIRQKVHWW